MKLLTKIIMNANSGIYYTYKKFQNLESTYLIKEKNLVKNEISNFFLSNDLYHLPTTACDIFGIITKKTIEIQMFRLLMKETYTVSSKFKMKNMLSLQLKVVRDRRI